MSDFNVTKLENGDFEVTKIKSHNKHQTKILVLATLWMVFIITVAIMSIK
jgi:hypothetical protein